jgi:hypothetical protein
MTPEGKVKKSVKDILKARGVWYYMPVSFGMGRAGIPDFLCLHRGKFFAIETKAGKNPPTKLQERVIATLRQHGASVLVVNEENVADITALLDYVELVLVRNS